MQSRENDTSSGLSGPQAQGQPQYSSAIARSLQGRGSICLLGMLVFVVFVSGGATCFRRTRTSEFLPPVVFHEPPSLSQITERLNHSLAIESLESNNLSVSSPDFRLKLNGDLKWQRPHNFKLEAYVGSKALGKLFSAGSNSELFWLQSPRESPPKLYYARHDEFNRQSGPKHILPISPLWLREALGVIEFDPQLVHQEPIMRSDGKMEVRSFIGAPNGNYPEGAYRRHVVFDPQTVAIEQTLLYSSTKLIAVAQQSDHEYYAAIDYNLPHHVDVQLYPDTGEPISFSIDVGFYMINQGFETTHQEFALPESVGLTTVNIARVNQNGQLPVQPPAYSSAVPSTPAAPVGFNRYQGVVR